MSPARRVLQAMGDGEPWTVPEIAHWIGHPPNNVRGIVLRYERAGMITRLGQARPEGRGRPPFLFVRSR